MLDRAVSVSVAASLALILSGSVPIVADFASCNAEAIDTVTSAGFRAPVPNTKDRDRAAAARRGLSTASEDAQVTGMDPEGAKDPAYQAAYRTCMRRRGF